MRAITTVLFLFLNIALFGQVNDAESIFNGSYDKSFIRKHRISQLTVEAYINNNKTSVSVFDFDRNGLVSKQTVFDSTGQKVNDYIFSYNKEGDQIERKTIAYERNKTYTTTFNKTYAGSHLIQESSSELPFITKHFYDSNGRKVQSITFLDADTTKSAKRISFYDYDTKGNLKFVKEAYDNNGSSPAVATISTEYIYDAAGNATAVIREGKPGYYLSYDKKGLLSNKTVTMPEELGGLKIVDEYSYSFWK